MDDDPNGGESNGNESGGNQMETGMIGGFEVKGLGRHIANISAIYSHQ